MNMKLNLKDEMIMKLVHYFITEEDYQPMIVKGVENEIWLENIDAEYKIIRINSNHIFNEEQLKLDLYKIKNIAKQIKNKTLSFKVPTLNILLDLNESVKLKEEKNVSTVNIRDLNDVIKDKNIKDMFPKLPTYLVKDDENVDLFMNLTNDINQKTKKENKTYEKIFNPKNVYITPVLIFINIAIFVLTMTNFELFDLFILDPSGVKNGEIWRVFTSMFMHGNLIHLLVNMYSLSIIGPQIENFAGRTKYLIIYLLSGLTASLVSVVISNTFSLGASGAIFGLLGSLGYFAYNYRVYFGNFLKNQILPIILINLFIGFTIPNIDNAAHIGGLIGGIFLSMIVRVSKKEDKYIQVNAIISYLILLIFLAYLIAQ